MNTIKTLAVAGAVVLSAFFAQTAQAQLQPQQKQSALDYTNPPLKYYRITDQISYTEIDFSKQEVTTDTKGQYVVKLPFVIDKAVPAGDVLWLLLYVPNGSSFDTWAVYTANGNPLVTNDYATYKTSDETYVVGNFKNLQSTMTAGKYYLEMIFKHKPQAKECKISVAYSSQQIYNNFIDVLNENATLEKEEQPWLLDFYRVGDNVTYQKIDFSALHDKQHRKNDDGTYSILLLFNVENIPAGEVFWLALRCPKNFTMTNWGIYNSDVTFICKNFNRFETKDYTYILQSQDNLIEQIKTGEYLLKIIFKEKPSAADVEISVGYSPQKTFDSYLGNLQKREQEYKQQSATPTKTSQASNSNSSSSSQPSSSSLSSSSDISGEWLYLSLETWWLDFDNKGYGKYITYDEEFDDLYNYKLEYTYDKSLRKGTLKYNKNTYNFSVSADYKELTVYKFDDYGDDVKFERYNK